jgi:2-haloacid dehalogenase
LSVRGFVFDAYGTLLDVRSVDDAARAITPDPEALTALWRQKQLEYTWLRSLMGRWEDFWTVTGDALRFAVRKLGIPATDAQLAKVLDAYLSLAPFPEATAALERLRGRPRAILSNGSRRMLDAAVRSSGLGPLLTQVLSVDEVRAYKPSPAVYALSPKALGVPAGELLFVSSNAWDVAGAKAFGYRVCWCNRQGAPAEELGVAPDLVVSRLDEIPL